MGPGSDCRAHNRSSVGSSPTSSGSRSAGLRRGSSARPWRRSPGTRGRRAHRRRPLPSRRVSAPRERGSSECRDVQHPVRGFNQGVDPGSGLKTRVRRPPRDSDFERATALAARLQDPVVGCALEDEYMRLRRGPAPRRDPRGVRGSRRRSSSEQMAGTLQPLAHHRAEQPADGAGHACRSLDMAHLCHLREVTRPVCSADDSERPVNQVCTEGFCSWQGTVRRRHRQD